MIRAVIFDFGEVFAGGMDNVEHTFARILNIEPQAVRAALHVREATIPFFEGRATEDEYWQLIFREHSWSQEICSIARAKEIMRENFQEIPGVRQIIENLRKQKFKLGLLSVHGKDWIEHCQAIHNHHCLFDIIHYS